MGSTGPAVEPSHEEEWRHGLVEGHGAVRLRRQLFGLLPANPRCRMCHAPFGGLGGRVMRLMGKRPFAKNPSFCDPCMKGVPLGGAEVPLTMLFADVRGSTSLAEKTSAAEFARLMNRFYGCASNVFIRSQAWVDKLVGDEVIALYIPGFAGPRHAHAAVQAGIKLLRLTGHAGDDGPWLPVGVGVNTGTAYVGTVGSEEEGIRDITALGDAMNTAARLVGVAAQGEIVLSEVTYNAAELHWSNLEQRELTLKGKDQPVTARVLRVAPGQT